MDQSHLLYKIVTFQAPGTMLSTISTINDTHCLLPSVAYVRCIVSSLNHVNANCHKTIRLVDRFHDFPFWRRLCNSKLVFLSVLTFSDTLTGMGSPKTFIFVQSRTSYRSYCIFSHDDPICERII